jgi:O-Antigen ligase
MPMPPMTSLPLGSDRRPVLFPVLCIGGVIGVLVALGLYSTKPAYVALLPLGLLIVLPAMILKNFRLYWLALLLLSLQFQIGKNLNDGLAVLSALKIDYIIDTFTFDITATDLVLLVLLAIWINDRLFHAKPFRFPAVSWLAVGYLGIALLSALAAPSRYLGLVEVVRQAKFFVVYLFAVNCIDSKGALRVLAVVGVVILVTQAAVTVARFETGNLTPLVAGDTHQDEDQMKNYLTVDRSDPNSLVRAFGTLTSPNGTTRLCLLVIPFALFLSVPNGMFRTRFGFAALATFGLLGLILTFTRVWYITAVFQLGLAFIIMVRDRLLKRGEILLIVGLGLVAAAVVSPKLYQQFTVREDSVSVRVLQNETALAMTLDSPFLGVGLNNAPDVMRKYSTVTYQENDATTQFYTEPINNMLLSMLAEIGVFGTLLFFGFFGKVTLVAWRQSRRSTDPEIRFIANALVVVFCGVALNAVLDPFSEYQVLALSWLYAGIALNLPLMDQSPQAAGQRLAHRPG